MDLRKVSSQFICFSVSCDHMYLIVSTQWVQVKLQSAMGHRVLYLGNHSGPLLQTNILKKTDDNKRQERKNVSMRARPSNTQLGLGERLETLKEQAVEAE